MPLMFIIALLLAWPTFGLSLIVYFSIKIYTYAARKEKLIEFAIEKLGEEGSLGGTAFKEISYSNAKAYAESNRSKILVNGTEYNSDYVEFKTSIRGDNYIVSLTKTFDGHGSVLTSRKA